MTGEELNAKAKNSTPVTIIVMIGMRETLMTQEAYGFFHTGVFADSGRKRFLLLEQNGIKLGIASCSGFYNKSVRDFSTKQRVIYLNHYAEQKMCRDLSAMKKQGAEYIIVYYHGLILDITGNSITPEE